MKTRRATFLNVFAVVILLSVFIPSFAFGVPIVTALFTGLSAGSGDETGMDALNDFLQDAFSGISFSSQVFGHSQQSNAVEFINSITDPATVVLIGHSLGGDSVIETAQLLDPRTIDLLIQIESIGVGDEQLPDNVETGINYFQISTGPFEPQGAQNVEGSVNINVETLFGDDTSDDSTSSCIGCDIVLGGLDFTTAGSTPITTVDSITHTSIDGPLDQRLYPFILQNIQLEIDPLLWFNPNIGTVFGTPSSQFTLGDDDFAGPINLGFDFPFFGETYDDIFFNSNGTLTFNEGRASWDNYSFPRSGTDQFNQTVVPTIAPFFDDHDNRFGGTLSFINTIPGTFVSTWEDVPLYNNGTSGGATNSFQSVLFGDDNPFDFDSGTVVFNYGSLNGTGGTCDNNCGSGGFEDSVGTATIGLNNGDGVNFIIPSGLGIGSGGGLITPADFPLLMDRTFVDPLFFTPSANSGSGASPVSYTVSAVPFSALPSLSGFTSNAPTPVPEPSSVVLFVTGFAGLLLARKKHARRCKL